MTGRIRKFLGFRAHFSFFLLTRACNGHSTGLHLFLFIIIIRDLWTRWPLDSLCAAPISFFLFFFILTVVPLSLFYLRDYKSSFVSPVTERKLFSSVIKKKLQADENNVTGEKKDDSARHRLEKVARSAQD